MGHESESLFIEVKEIQYKGKGLMVVLFKILISVGKLFLSCKIKQRNDAP